MISDIFKPGGPIRSHWASPSPYHPRATSRSESLTNATTPSLRCRTTKATHRRAEVAVRPNCAMRCGALPNTARLLSWLCQRIGEASASSRLAKHHATCAAVASWADVTHHLRVYKSWPKQGSGSGSGSEFRNGSLGGHRSSLSWNQNKSGKQGIRWTQRWKGARCR